MHQESFNSCISSVSSISFSTSPRQSSKTQPATSTLEKVGEAWREYQALFLCPKQNWCSLQCYTGHYYFQTAQIDRGALCLKKISPVNQCIMDVEQISWAAIPDNQEQIIRYAALHRINVVYEYALILIQACTRLLLFATSAGGLPDSVKWSIRAWHIILCRFPSTSDFLFLNDKMSSIFRWKDWSTHMSASADTQKFSISKSGACILGKIRLLLSISCFWIHLF